MEVFKNAVISAANYGSYRLRCVEINHGMNIVSEEAVARMHKALYVTKRTSGSFNATFIFTRQIEQQWFSDWIQSYARLKSNPDTPVREMRMMVPVIGFDKWGVPVVDYGTGELPYGDEVGATAYRTTLQFVGTRDTIDENGPLVSRYVGPTSTEDKAAPHFYPGGTQLKAGEYGEDWLYNLNKSLNEVMPDLTGYMP